MVNVKKALYQGYRYQGFDPEDILICFNLILKEEYYLQNCFFVDEDDDTLTVVTTTMEGTEELRIVPKQSIIYIQPVYDADVFLDEPEEKIDSETRMYV